MKASLPREVFVVLREDLARPARKRIRERGHRRVAGVGYAPELELAEVLAGDTRESPEVGLA